jgi:hypothetical protein
MNVDKGEKIRVPTKIFACLFSHREHACHIIMRKLIAAAQQLVITKWNILAIKRLWYLKGFWSNQLKNSEISS